MSHCSQESIDDVAQTADAKFEHDAEMAAEGDIQLRIPDVPKHDCW